MRIVIFNLPVPEIYDEYQRANHQIFADYSFIINSNKNNTIIKLSRDVTDRLNNKGIVNYILNLKSDVVGFSSYVWNIERNIAISKELRKQKIITITGGPEIQNEKYIKYFDIVVVGEGESFIQTIDKNKINDFLQRKIIYMKDEKDINLLYPQYAIKTDDYIFDKFFYLEVERGCPFNCNYCAYAKARKNICSLDFHKFKESVDEIFKKDIDEIYLLSPTLNRDKKRFKLYLDYFIEKKRITGKDIKLFGELRPEMLTDDEIDLMYLAGFKEIEFGVQTFKKEILNNHSRKYKNYNPINLSLKIIEKGLNPIIDFIIGLPGDTENNLYETIELLDKNNILKYSSFYHLQVLPGTELEKKADSINIIYDKNPPYFILKNQSIDLQGIKNIYGYLESEKSHSYYERIRINDAKRFYILKYPDSFVELERTPYYQTGSLFFDDVSKYDLLLRMFTSLYDNSPEIFHIHYFVARSTGSLEIIKRLKDIFLRNINYYDRYRESINYSGEDLFSKQIEVLIPADLNPQIYDFYYNNGFETAFISFNDKPDNKILNICQDKKIFLYVSNDSNLSGENVIKLPFDNFEIF